LSDNLIIYVGGFILPDGNAAAHRVRTISKLLLGSGYQPVFLGFNTSQQKNVNFLNTKTTTEEGDSYALNYPSTIWEWFRNLFSIGDIKRIVEYYGRKKIKAIIAYNYPGVSLNRLRLYCKLNDIYIISDCTEWYSPPISSNLPFYILKKLDTLLRMQFVNKQIDGIITISKYLYDYYSTCKCELILVPPLVDLKDKKWSYEKSVPDDMCRIVYAGSLGRGNKDKLDKVIDALSRIRIGRGRSFTFDIIGINKNEYCRIFKRKMIPANLSGHLTFYGRVNHNEVLSIIKKVDYSLFLRDQTIMTKSGFPTKFVESISCGTPVLTNDTSDLKDYLQDSLYGFMINDSTEELLTSSIDTAINITPKEILRKKEFCRESKLFDITNYSTQFDEFLRAVFKG